MPVWFCKAYGGFFPHPRLYINGDLLRHGETILPYRSSWIIFVQQQLLSFCVDVSWHKWNWLCNLGNKNGIRMSEMELNMTTVSTAYHQSFDINFISRILNFLRIHSEFKEERFFSRHFDRNLFRTKKKVFFECKLSSSTLLIFILFYVHSMKFQLRSLDMIRAPFSTTATHIRVLCIS